MIWIEENNWRMVQDIRFKEDYHQVKCIPAKKDTEASKQDVKKGSTLCLAKVCGGEDSMEHIMECKFYDTKPPKDDSERAMTDYLVRLNYKRNQKYSEALVYTRNIEKETLISNWSLPRPNYAK